jgi:lipid-binding SYLF domain-containing protein
MKHVRKLVMIALLANFAACTTQQSQPSAGSMAQPSAGSMAQPSGPNAAQQVLEANAAAALAALYQRTPKAKELGDKAKGILVFPDVVRAGFIAGASHGSGVLYENGKVTGDYATTSVSYGFQAGAQTYGYAMFIMTDAELNKVKSNSDYEVGLGPTIVVADNGTAQNLTTTTLQADVYAFIFNQNGLMAGSALRGTKISRITAP